MELGKEFKSINFNEKSENIREGFELDYQLNLPQYLEDIERLIKCCVKNVVCDYELTGSSIKLYGKSLISILYLDAEGCPYSAELEEDFSKTFDLKDCDFYYFAKVFLKTKYYNHRLINQRRIDIHVSLSVCIDVFCKNPSKCLTQCNEAFVKQEKLSVLSEKNGGICSAEFDETFCISKNDYQIKNIVNTFTCVCVDETKIIKDKMLVKINCELSVLYINENNSLEKCVHTFSVSKIIDIAECDEDNKAFVNACVSQLYVKAKSDDNNLLNDIEAVGRLAIEYKIFSDEKADFATDLYIPHYNTDIKSSSLNIKNNPTFYYDDKTVETILDSDRSIIEIIDINAHITDCKIESSVLKAQTLVAVIYYDDTSTLCYLEKSIDISFTLCDVGYDGEAVLNLKSFDFVIKNTDKISLRLNIEYSAFLYTLQSINYITDADACDERCDGDSPELTLYFAKEKENLWDIAKSFMGDMTMIKEENNLSSDVIESNRVLLIPGM